MSSCNIVAIHTVGKLHYLAPFYLGIADNTRIGSTSGKIFVNEVFYDTIPKLLPDVEKMVRKPHFGSHTSCLHNRIYSATALLPFETTLRYAIPSSVRYAHKVVSLTQKQYSCHSRVYAPTHRQKNLFFVAHLINIKIIIRRLFREAKIQYLFRFVII